jgi:DNA repair protein RecO (recombination protein O)
MEATYPTKAIILDRYYFREYDSRILAYSAEYGLLELIARGTRRARSKLAAHLEPMSLSELMVVSGRQYDYVGSARVSEAFSCLKSDYSRLLFAGRALRLAKRLLQRGQADREVFALLISFFRIINSQEQSEAEAERTALAFAIGLVSALGYSPETASCLQCGRGLGARSSFDCANGGALCADCARSQKGLLLVSDACLSFWGHASQGRLAMALASQGNDNDEIEKILQAYLRYNLELEF